MKKPEAAERILGNLLTDNSDEIFRSISKAALEAERDGSHNLDVGYIFPLHSRAMNRLSCFANMGIVDRPSMTLNFNVNAVDVRVFFLVKSPERLDSMRFDFMVSQIDPFEDHSMLRLTDRAKYGVVHEWDSGNLEIFKPEKIFRILHSPRIPQVAEP
jgi:hypothetical protein